MSYSDAALLLLGHGSTLNADSSAPTYRHAEELRRRGIFAEVQVAFWKEEPNFRQALGLIEAGTVYLVPNFISSGYFTEQVIPRELGLSGPVTEKEGRILYYTEPVGLHPAMTEALLQRAGEVVSASGTALPEPEKTACLFICGHGTSFNDNSTRIIHEQAEKIGALGRYAECRAVLMEQAPFVKDWRTLTTCPDVVVVPFFIADGLHSYEDIPVLLGLTPNIREKGFTNPHQEEGRRLWYASAIGTEPYLAEVILAQVKKSVLEHGTPGNRGKRHPRSWPIPDEPVQLGQVLISPGYTLRHVQDAARPAADLRTLTSLAELREVSWTDAAGKFRPLRAAPNLCGGWTYGPLNKKDCQLALDTLYPGAWGREEVPLASWAETAGRQTGRFRVVQELSKAEVLTLVEEECARGCGKRRLWAPAAQPTATPPGQLPLLCQEACNYLVGKAREKIKGGGEEG